MKGLPDDDQDGASETERAAAERLREALDDADAPGPRDGAVSADALVQVRAAVLLRSARATTDVAQSSPERFLETLQEVRARLGPLEAAAREVRARRVRRGLVWMGLAAALAAGVILPIVLRPPAPERVETRGYAKLFPAPFTREGRPSERLERIITWRREKR